MKKHTSFLRSIDTFVDARFSTETIRMFGRHIGLLLFVALLAMCSVYFMVHRTAAKQALRVPSQEQAISYLNHDLQEFSHAMNFAAAERTSVKV